MNDFFQSNLPTESTKYQCVEINLMASFYQELKTEFDQNRWTDKEGLYYVLAAGLAALQNMRQLQALSQDDSMIIT